MSASEQWGWLVAWGSAQAELQVVLHLPCQSSPADLQISTHASLLVLQQ